MVLTKQASRGFGLLSGATNAAAAAMMSLANVMPRVRIPFYQQRGFGQRRRFYDGSGSIAERNRNTGAAHEHVRESERRLRQEDRIVANQIARAKRAGVKDYADDGVTELAVGLTRTGHRVNYTLAEHQR